MPPESSILGSSRRPSAEGLGGYRGPLFFSASSRHEPYGKIGEAATSSPIDVNRHSATESSCHQQPLRTMAMIVCIAQT
jgi:hypothetical protein